MCNQSDDGDGDDGALQIDDEQILQRDGDLAAHDDTANLGHVDQLGHAGGGDHEAGQLALDGAGDDAGQEHIGKAHDDGLAGQSGLGDLEQVVQGDEGQAQQAENRGVLGNDQSQSAQSQDYGQSAEPHFGHVL